MATFNLQSAGPDQAQRRDGLTLLEIVAAMVLTVMLFAALTSLLRSFADQRRALDRLADSHPPTGRLEGLLRLDLNNARFVRATPKELTLVGNLAQDRTTGSPTGGRAEVTYRIETIADDPWLVRREVQVDVLSTERSFEELVWQGATAFEFVAMVDEWLPDKPTEFAKPTPNGMEAMPSRFQLVVRGDKGKQLVLLNVVHHWEDN